MNAIVALCHFCDHHGPRVMMCTQAFNGTLDAQLLYDSTQPPQEPKVKEDVTITTTAVDGSSSSVHICDACRSFPEGHTGIISHDAKANVYYVSTQRPLEKDAFVIARQACLGSLTFEAPEGFEGPMLFGENPDIYVLSYQFFLNDSKARGKRRRYSLIVVMKDQFYLINSWTFIVNNFRRIIKSWQDRAAKVYSKETGTESTADDKTKSLDNMRWHAKTSYSRRSLSKDEVARPLVELIKHKGVFLDLHQDLMIILQGGRCQWEERQVEWPPTAKPRPPPPQPLEESPMVPGDSGWEVLEVATKGSLESVVSSCELVDRRMALERESINGAAVRSLKHLYQLTGHNVFTRLAYHTLKGDLVIVRGCEKTTVASVLSLLATLIPERCCKTIVYSTKYDESYRYTCNLLGLAVGQEVPDTVCNAKDCVILDIYPPLEDSYSSPSPPTSTPSSSSSLSDSIRSSERLSKYKFLMSNKPSSEQPGQPSLLQQYIKVLTNPHFSDILVDQFVTGAKREWLNKAKLLYRLSKSGLLDEESQREEKLPQLQSLLQLQAGKNDLDILRFWFSGISDEERIQIMSYSLTS